MQGSGKGSQPDGHFMKRAPFTIARAVTWSVPTAYPLPELRRKRAFVLPHCWLCQADTHPSLIPQTSPHSLSRISSQTTRYPSRLAQQDHATAGTRTTRAPASKRQGRDIGNNRRRREHVQKERQADRRGRDRRLMGAVVGRAD
jgi:hypothetical protein